MSDMLRELWQHQKDGVSFALEKKNFAWFYEMGAGKTGTAITTLRYLYARKGHVRRTLIFSPLITLENWKREFAFFSKIKDTDIIVLNHKSGAAKRKAFVKATMDYKGSVTKNRIVIVNYESVQNKELYAAFKAWNPEILIMDEAHKLKNHKSKRAVLVRELADRAEHKYLLTGSPVLNSAQDIFHLYRILDGGEAFGVNFYAFRNRYFEDINAKWQTKRNYFPDFRERMEMMGEIHDKMYYFGDRTRRAHRVLKKDCLDLPPFIRQTIKVPLGVEQAKMYKQMKNEFITFIEREKDIGTPIAVVANLAVTKALRMMQITSGFVKGEDGGEYPVRANPRMDALRDLVETGSVESKIIIWAKFKQNHKDIAYMLDGLGVGYTLLNGSLDAKQKEESMRAFREDDSVRVIVANQQAAGIGVNLVEANTSIYYSYDFSLENDMQSEARNYRGGSDMHAKVTRIDLVAENTIDELVIQALSTKQKLADRILDIASEL